MLMCYIIQLATDKNEWQVGDQLKVLGCCGALRDVESIFLDKKWEVCTFEPTEKG